MLLFTAFVTALHPSVEFTAHNLLRKKPVSEPRKFGLKKAKVFVLYDEEDQANQAVSTSHEECYGMTHKSLL